MDGTPYTLSMTQAHWALIYTIAQRGGIIASARWGEIEEENLNMSVTMYGDRTLESRPPEQYDDLSPMQRYYDMDGSPLWCLFTHKEK